MFGGVAAQVKEDCACCSMKTATSVGCSILTWKGCVSGGGEGGVGMEKVLNPNTWKAHYLVQNRAQNWVHILEQKLALFTKLAVETPAFHATPPSFGRNGARAVAACRRHGLTGQGTH
jgi:hypothetical protein